MLYPPNWCKYHTLTVLYWPCELEEAATFCPILLNSILLHIQSFSLSFTHLDTPEPAVLQYELLKDNSVDLYHTGVPVAFRGKGIAKVLAKVCVKVKVILNVLYVFGYLGD